MRQVSCGQVKEVSIDEFDHMSMQEYIRIINEGIQQMSQACIENRSDKTSKARFVASRLSIEYKAELRMGDEWTLWFQEKNLDENIVEIAFRIRSKDRIHARGSVIALPFNVARRRTGKLTGPDVTHIKAYLSGGRKPDSGSAV